MKKIAAVAAVCAAFTVFSCWLEYIPRATEFPPPAGLILTDSAGKILYERQALSEAYLAVGLWREHLTQVTVDPEGNETVNSITYYLYPFNESSPVKVHLWRANIASDGTVVASEKIREQTVTVTDSMYQTNAGMTSALPLSCRVLSIADDLSLATAEMPCLVYGVYETLGNSIPFAVSSDSSLGELWWWSQPNPTRIMSVVAVRPEGSTATTTVREVDFSGSSLAPLGNALPLTPLATIAPATVTTSVYNVVSNTVRIRSIGQALDLTISGDIAETTPTVTTQEVPVTAATLRITDSENSVETWSVSPVSAGTKIPIFGRYNINPWGIAAGESLSVKLSLTAGNFHSDVGAESVDQVTPPGSATQTITVSGLDRPER